MGFQATGRKWQMVSTLARYHLGNLADEHASFDVDRQDHTWSGENFMSTGFTLDGFPACAWETYALGSENENLPAFVAPPIRVAALKSSANNWGPGFLPTR